MAPPATTHAGLALCAWGSGISGGGGRGAAAPVPGVTHRGALRILSLGQAGARQVTTQHATTRHLSESLAGSVVRFL